MTNATLPTEQPSNQPAPAMVVTTQATGRVYLLRRVGLVVALVALIAVVAGTAGAFDGLLGREADGDPAAGLVGGAGGPATPSEAGVGAVTEAPAELPVSRPDSSIASRPIAEPTTEPAGIDEAREQPLVIENDAVIAPPRASRLVPQAPERLLDTRSDGEEPLPPARTHTITIPADRTAAALSVTLMGSERSGSVVVDGLAGSVEAVSVGAAGVTTTNLVTVPVAAAELTVRTSAGGHLVVDLVATFEAAPAGSAGGRLQRIEATRVTDMETAVDGRDGTITFTPGPLTAAPADDGQTGPARDGGPASSSALLVLITADVGDDGGVVRLGPATEDYDQMLMWGPTVDGRQRRALALVEPGPDGTSALRYEGGTAITVDVVAYFTGESDEVATAGLFVPAGPRLLYSGPLEADQPVELSGIDPADGLALTTVGTRSAQGARFWTGLAEVEGGVTQVSSPVAQQVDVTLLGVFLGS